MLSREHPKRSRPTDVQQWRAEYEAAVAAAHDAGLDVPKAETD